MDDVHGDHTVNLLEPFNRINPHFVWSDTDHRAISRMETFAEFTRTTVSNVPSVPEVRDCSKLWPWDACKWVKC